MKTFFCYLSRTGYFRTIENPSDDLDPDSIWDMSISFGIIEARDKYIAERKSRDLMGKRLKKLGLIKR